MIWCLFLSLVTFAFFNYKISGTDLFNPAVLVSTTFCIFSFFCCLANIYIGIDIDTTLIFLVIGTGIGIFTIVEYLFGQKTQVGLANYKKINIGNANVNKIWMLTGIIVLLLTIYVNYKYIMAFGAAYGAGGDFASAAVQYKVITTIYDNDAILLPSPWYRNYLSVAAYAFAYLSAYLFLREKVLRKKFSIFPFFIIILFAIYTLMGAGRSTFFQFITALLFLWYIFLKNSNATTISNKKIIFKLIIILSFVCVICILLFYLIGRTQNDLSLDNVMSSLFVYAGAPIFNLDIYLQNPWKQTHGLFGELTFIKLINWIGIKFDISSFIYELDLPFLSYQNYALGNVYTTFYTFYYDFQFLGVVFLTLFMAIFSIWLYNKVRNEDLRKAHISLVTILYSYLVNDLIMLAFSNRFYETITDVGIYYKILLLSCMVYCINKFSLTFDRKGLRLMKIKNGGKRDGE